MDHLVSPQSAFALQVTAAFALWLHVAAGSLALISGGAALACAKGSKRHAAAGRSFVFSMAVMATLGGILATLLVSPQGDARKFDALMGALAFYLVATGWFTMNRRLAIKRRIDLLLLLMALTIAAVAMIFALQAEASPNGLAGGYAASGYYILAGLATFAAIGDFRVFLQRGVTGKGRISRHLWRMCLALFIAAGSFFLGQQKVMPESVQGSPLLMIPPLLALAAIPFFLIRLRFAKALARFFPNRLSRPAPAPSSEQNAA